MTGASLKAWRERLGFNKSRAALELGCSRATILDYENGRNDIPRYIALACAAIALGVKEFPDVGEAA